MCPSRHPCCPCSTNWPCSICIRRGSCALLPQSTVTKPERRSHCWRCGVQLPNLSSRQARAGTYRASCGVKSSRMAVALCLSIWLTRLHLLLLRICCCCCCRRRLGCFRAHDGGDVLGEPWWCWRGTAPRHTRAHQSARYERSKHFLRMPHAMAHFEEKQLVDTHDACPHPHNHAPALAG